LAIACNNLSFVQRKRDLTAAESTAKEAIAILERLIDDYPGQVPYQDDLALCYNNLAALASHQHRMAEAVASHTRAIDLQEQLVRKAPAVVRHRSDLAISLNNLGVAYCRSNRPDDADDAFVRARELLATLAEDYPDELAYRSSLAALLNNQALALADAGRHEEALRIYPTAIESQRICFERSSQSVMPRELLSKMYYNYRRSLQAVGRFDEAAAAALARSELWDGNAERLFGVAVELAGIDCDARDTAGRDKLPGPTVGRDFGDEVMATLRQVRKIGWPSEVDLASDDRFAYLHGDASFGSLLAELRTRSNREPEAY
jgi:tetratricopeptide (TPR) repeat protein